jgi:hypothetical protein
MNSSDTVVFFLINILLKYESSGQTFICREYLYDVKIIVRLSDHNKKDFVVCQRCSLGRFWESQTPSSFPYTSSLWKIKYSRIFPFLTSLYYLLENFLAAPLSSNAIFTRQINVV